jgi:hypothetical protein
MSLSTQFSTMTMQVFSEPTILPVNCYNRHSAPVMDAKTSFVTLTLSRADRDIAFVVAGGFESEGVYLDNLRFQDYSSVSEPGTLGLFGATLIALVWCRRRCDHAFASAY